MTSQLHPLPPSAGREASPQTMAQLFVECHRSLLSVLMVRLGNEHEAQEVAQEAYARLLQLDPAGTLSFPRAYLFKTAVNLATDRARQRSARTRLDQLDAARDEDAIDGANPERSALAAEQLGLIERALRELPPKYRRAFLLHRFENWTTEQIGRELSVRKRMVRNYVARAAIYCRLRLDGVAPDAAWAEAVR